MKILMAGDIVGAPGRRAFAEVVSELRKAGRVDFVIGNAENVAGGRGVTPEIADQLFKAGADVLTLGDHTWDQKSVRKYLDSEARIVRPINFPPGCPGRGAVTINSPWGPITVVSVIGRVFMQPNDCPFRAMDAFLKGRLGQGGPILVDIHAEATSEKIVLGRYLDGRVTCVAGTHTHVQTSDETILPKGTAYITDLGMTGPKDSAIGRDLESITGRFLTGIPNPFKVGTHDVVLEGLIVEVQRDNGRVLRVERIRQRTGVTGGDDTDN